MNVDSHPETPVYPDHSQPVGERVRDLLARMTLEVTAGGCSPGARGIALGAPEPGTAMFTVE